MNVNSQTTFNPTANQPVVKDEDKIRPQNVADTDELMQIQEEDFDEGQGPNFDFEKKLFCQGLRRTVQGLVRCSFPCSDVSELHLHELLCHKKGDRQKGIRMIQLEQKAREEIERI